MDYSRIDLFKAHVLCILECLRFYFGRFTYFSYFSFFDNFKIHFVYFEFLSLF